MRLRTAAALLAMSFVASRLQAQQVWGSIRGRVVDDSTAVAGALVQVSGSDLLGPRAAATDHDGYFHIEALPPGSYVLRVTRLGRRPVTIEQVVVELGRLTSLAPTHMETAPTLLDEVRITANRFSIDPTTTSAETILTPQDYAALPGERDYRYVLDLLPDIIDSGRGDAGNANGATGLENTYFIDGINVTEELKAEWATSLPINFIKAVEVKTGGYEAQYGKALGAVVNAVTYSGTNDFSINVFGFGTNHGLSAKPRAEPALQERHAVRYDVGVRLAGPIIRDRLWYSAAYNPRIWHADEDVTALGIFRDTHRMNVYAAKASLRASKTTNFELSVFGDPAIHHIVAGPGGSTPLSASSLLQRFEAGQNVTALHGTMILSHLLLEGSAATSSGKLNLVGDTDAGQNQPLFLNYSDNTFSGGIGVWSKARLGRRSYTLKGTATLGPHLTVAGIEYEDVSAFRDLGWSGGYLLETINAGGFRTTSEGAPGTFHNRVPTAYLQNSWHTSDALTINSGLRWSMQTLTGVNGTVAQKFPNEWQPRVGVVWQPGGSTREKVFASFGRFYLQIPLNIASLWYLDYPYVLSFYSHDPRQPGAVPDSVMDLTAPAGAWLQSARIHGLQVENSDEITVGYERLIGTSLRFTSRAVRRDLRSSFMFGFDPAKGAFYLGTPGKGNFTILPRPVRQYRALEIGFDGSWRKTDFRSSYMLSRNRGNYPGLYNSDQGFANPGGIGTFITPEQAANSTGLLPDDRTHLFKVSGSRPTVFGLTAGTVITLESGSPMNAFGYTPFGFPLFVLPRGSVGRTPWLWDANFRLIEDLPAQGRARARVILDALHVGNPQRPVRLIETKYQPQIGNGLPIENPNYRRPLTFQPPMMARLGIEADF